MPYFGTAPSSELANLDINGQKFILDADADTSITADTDDTIDIEIAGADDFQFTANTFTAKSGSTIAAQALTATTIATSSTIDLNGNELILDADADTSITADTDDTIDFKIAGADAYEFKTSSFTLASVAEFIQTDGNMYLSETSNANMTRGLTLNQATIDVEILALKSSDIAHGMTDDTETDTYFSIKKSSGTAGAPKVFGLGEGTQGIRIVGQCTTADTAKSTSANAPVILRGIKKSSATNAAMGTNENVVVIEGCTAGPGFIFDAEGSMHSNAANAVYDAFDDAELVRTIDQSLSTKGLIASKFDEFVQYSHEDLADAGLVGRDDDGTPNGYVNWMHLSKLHNGAIWQQHEKHANLLNAVYELAVEAVGEDKADEILDKHDIKLLSKHKLIN